MSKRKTPPKSCYGDGTHKKSHDMKRCQNVGELVDLLQTLPRELPLNPEEGAEAGLQPLWFNPGCSPENGHYGINQEHFALEEDVWNDA